MQTGDEIRLTLDRMAHGGEAVGRLDGQAVFVRGAIPGEDVTARVVTVHPRYLKAVATRVNIASPDRVEPPCERAGSCGGCHWQHIAYPAQLRFKQQILSDQLARVGKVADPPVAAVAGMDYPWEYRCNAEFSLTADGQLGFHGADPSVVIPARDCRLLHRNLRQFLACAWQHPAPSGVQRVELRESAVDEVHAVELTTARGIDVAEWAEALLDCDKRVAYIAQDDGTPSDDDERPFIRQRVRERDFRVSMGSFFQVNVTQVDVLLEHVLSLGGPQATEVVLDLYSGVGLFAAFLAPLSKRVSALEESQTASVDAVFNLHGQKNVKVFQGAVEAILEGLKIKAGLALVDPPRTGLSPHALSALLVRPPQRLVYISCEPVSLARDVERLSAQGYVLRRVQPVDMFPQTYHLESVALLDRA